jgi:hypothetical protein
MNVSRERENKGFHFLNQATPFRRLLEDLPTTTLTVRSHLELKDDYEEIADQVQQ